MPTKTNTTSFEEGFRLLGINIDSTANSLDNSVQKSPEASTFSIYSAITSCHIIYNSNSTHPEDKDAKLG